MSAPWNYSQVMNVVYLKESCNIAAKWLILKLDILKNKNWSDEAYFDAGVKALRWTESGEFLAVWVQLQRALDHIWLSLARVHKQPLTDLVTTIPHCRQLCCYDTAVCVLAFSIHIKTVGHLTALSPAGGWRVLTLLVCVYLRLFTFEATGSAEVH